MSTFNVHEWNRKRRLEEMESSIPGLMRDKSGIIKAIYNVIDLGRKTELLSDDEIEVLEKLSYSVSDKLVNQKPSLQKF